MAALGRGLAGLEGLRRLDLSHNEVGDAGVRSLLLASGRTWTALCELGLASSGIGVEGVGSLALALGGSSRLCALRLAGNRCPLELAWTLGLPPLHGPAAPCRPECSARDRPSVG